MVGKHLPKVISRGIILFKMMDTFLSGHSLSTVMIIFFFFFFLRFRCFSAPSARLAVALTGSSSKSNGSLTGCTALTTAGVGLQVKAARTAAVGTAPVAPLPRAANHLGLLRGGPSAKSKTAPECPPLQLVGLLSRPAEGQSCRLPPRLQLPRAQLA